MSAAMTLSRSRIARKFWALLVALSLLFSMLAQVGFASLQLPDANAAVGDLGVSNHEGQLKAGDVVGNYSDGAITEYGAGDQINFRLTLANAGAGPASGDFVIEWSGDSAACQFFQENLSLGIWNDEAAAAVVPVSGAAPTVSLVGVPQAVAEDWVQQIHVDFPEPGSAVMHYYLTLSADAVNCDGSVQYSRTGNAPPDAVGDFGDVTAQSVAVPADSLVRPEEPPAEDPVEPVADLQVSVDDGVESVLPGETVVYTITYGNLGPADSSNVTLTAALPANTVFDPATSSEGWVEGPAQEYSLAVGDLAGDGSGNSSVHLAVTVAYPFPDGVSDVTSVVSMAGDYDDDGATASDSTPVEALAQEPPAEDPVEPVADLQVSVDDGVESVLPGGTVVYAITYGNLGPADSSNVTLTAALPANTVFDPVNSSEGWVEGPAQEYSLAVGDLAGDGSVNSSIHFSVIVADPFPDGVEDVTSVVSIAGDYDDDGATASDSTPVEALAQEPAAPVAPVADLQVSVDDGVESVLPGGTVVYAITYGNLGPADSSNVTLTAALPANTVFDPATSSEGWVAVEGPAQKYSLAVGDLAGDGSGNSSVHLAVTVAYPFPDGVSDVTSVVSIAGDYDDDGATASDTNLVEALAPELWTTDAAGNPRLDFAPNETVYVHGSGFAASTPFDIPVIRPDGSIVKGDGSFVSGWDTTTTDGEGNLYYEYILNGIEGLYTLETYGSPWDGVRDPAALVATQTFTDSTTATDWTQCANDTIPATPDGVQDPCDWINGSLNANNSVLTEGDVVPHRLFALEDASIGSKFLVFNYEFYQSSQDAYLYDFLASPDVTLGSDLNGCGNQPTTGSFASSFGNNPDLCDDMLVARTAVPIPSDSYPFVAGAEADVAARNFWFSCSYLDEGEPDDPDDDEWVLGGCTTPTLTLTGSTPNNTLGHNPGNQPPTSDESVFIKLDFTTTQPGVLAAVWLGSHLAKEVYWSNEPDAGFQGFGASSGSGSSFHVRLSEDDGGNIGQRDNQMNVSAVQPPGSITIVKDDSADSGTDFNFTATFPDTITENFQLDDDGDPTLPASKLFDLLTAGTYMFEEADPGPAYSLSFITCEGAINSTVTTDLDNNKVTIDLASGEDLTCTFGNDPDVVDQKVLKYHDRDASGDRQAGTEEVLAGWEFFVDANANGTWESGIDSDKLTTDSNGEVAFQLTPGQSYSICEVVQDGWVNSDPGTAPPCESTGTLVAGQTPATLEFGNFQQGTKSGTKFEDLNADGIWDPDGVDNIADNGDDETPLSNWVIRAYEDTSGDGVLQAGETTVADFDTTNEDGEYTLSLDPGTYVVCEVSKTDWAQSAPDPDNEKCLAVAVAEGVEDGGHAVTITSGSAEVGNDFGNFQQGTKEGIKFESADAAGPYDDVDDEKVSGWTIYLYKNLDGDVVVDAGAEAVPVASTTTALVTGAYSFEGLDPGDYIVCEAADSEWTQSYPTTATEGAADCAEALDAEAGSVANVEDAGYAFTVTSDSSEVGNDFGNFQEGTKEGFKFEDEDGDGVYEPGDGDVRLDGWTIEVYADLNEDGVLDPDGADNAPGGGDDETLVDSVVTGSDTLDTGEYEFTLSPGFYVVCEQQQVGWTQSAPLGTECAAGTGTADGGYGIEITSDSSEVGNDFGNFQEGTKEGFKFEDEDGDGVYEPGDGDVRLDGWTIEVYADLNEDGVLDPDGADNAPGGGDDETLVDSVVTGSDTLDTGEYEFTLSPGFYVVCEQQQVGWTQSAPLGTECAAGTGTADGGYGIEITSDSSEVGNDFGNFQEGTKEGFKFEDEDGDGVYEPGDGDVRLDGWTIEVYADLNEDGVLDPDGADNAPGGGDDETLVDSVVTGSDTLDTGEYEFTLSPGFYVVCEQQQVGWTQSAPLGTECAAGTGTADGGYGIEITSDSSEVGNDFGNFQEGTKEGFKFEDEDGDGVYEPGDGDVRLDGWTIEVYADLNEDGVLDPDGADNAPGGGDDETLVDSVVTGSDTLDTGEYEFTLSPGFYVVCEQQQVGWTQSAPLGTECAAGTGTADGGYGIEITSDSSEVGNDFGNFQEGTKEGFKFEDEDGDGVYEPGDGDVRLDGWTIEVYADLNEDGVLDPDGADNAPGGGDDETLVDSVVTGSDTLDTGEYEFTLSPGFYVVCEQQQVGWTQSAPLGTECAAGTGTADGGYGIEITSDSSEVGNDFGNFQEGTKEGFKFEDEDGDGVYEPGDGDVRLDGWTIEVYADLNEDGVLDPDGADNAPGGGDDETLVDSVVTGSDTLDTGEYEFTLSPGFYVVCEQQQVGWTQSAPLGTECAAGTGTADGGYGIEITSDSSEVGNDFGNFQEGTKEGFKFEDEDGDGVYEPGDGDVRLDGWTIEVYADLNEDGVLDPDGADNAPGGGDDETLVDSVVTGSDTLDTGEYEFTLSPGFYVVCEQQQVGWTQSAPLGTECAAGTGTADGGYGIEITSDSSEVGNDFGNFQEGTKEGFKFEDEDGDGVYEPGDGDVRLDGWTIEVYADLNEDGVLDPDGADNAPGGGDDETLVDSVVTGSDTLDTGEYEFTLSPGFYVVCEQQQVGWTQSAPLGTECAAGTGTADGGYGIEITSDSSEVGNDFGNFQEGTKEGFKFEDEDGDGVYEPGDGDVRLDGWTIEVYADLNEDGVLDPDGADNAPGGGDDETLVDSVVTGSDTLDTGEYEFTLSPGFYVVCEQQQVGWTQSAPLGTECAAGTGTADGGYGIEITSDSSEVGNDFGNFQEGTKEGFKFEDEDGDGVYEPGDGDVRLDGWTIEVYADLNEDGVLDPDGADNAPGGGDDETLVDSVVTGSDTLDTGEYEFTLSPGFYVVCEQQQVGWTQSAPLGTECAAGTGTADGGYGIEITSDSSEVGNDFGNFQEGTKEGFKFEDEDGDGVYEPGDGDVRLDGWTIEVYADLNEDGVLDPDGADNAPGGGDDETLVDSVVTGSDTLDTGEYEFTLSPGFYVVCEQQQVGWTQSAPLGTECAAGTGTADGGYGIEITSDSSEVGNDFGNFQEGTKEGFKFEDEDGDGVYEPGDGDVRLDGWTIEVYADLNEDGVLDPDGADNAPGGGDDETLVDSVVTGSDTLDTGEYEFTLSPGFYVVCEQQQVGWTQSAPLGTECAAGTGTADGGYGIEITSDSSEVGNDFGNFQEGTKEGFKFEDEDGDGVYEPGDGDVRLDGWTIEVYADLNEDGVLDPDGADNAPGGGDDETLVDSVVTGSDTLDTGEYEFTLSPGFYVVCEQQQVGWTQSAPLGTECAAGTGTADGGYGIEITSDSSEVGNDFGNFQEGTKEGFKFEDEDGDGVYEPGDGDVRLDGWTIEVYADLNEDGVLDPDGADNAPGGGDDETLVDSVVTGSDTLDTGEYEFTLSPGFYVVCEQQQVGWTQSAPLGTECAAGTGTADGGYGIEITSDSSEVGNDFGNWRQATKEGRKFHDINENGVDDDEPGLGGVTITAYEDRNGDKVLDADDQVDDSYVVAATAETAAGTGAYSMKLDPGDYIVCETRPDGWTQTLPNSGTPDSTSTCPDGSFGYAETFTSGQLAEGNDFGNFIELSVVTDTSFCRLTDDMFRLLYIQDPDSNNYNRYRLNSSNPGQWYYNVFYPGAPGDPVDLTITLPYPFVTQGANPIQVHEYVALNEDECFDPSPSLPGYTIGTEGDTESPAGYKIVVLEDYNPPEPGSTTTIQVTGMVPETGLLYVTVHMDYGLKKTSPWAKESNNATNAIYGTIGDPQPYDFSITNGLSHTATVSSYNDFKKNPGVAGTVTYEASGDPLEAVEVELKKGNDVIGTVMTDDMGFYMIIHKHKGKPTDYTVNLPGEGMSEQVRLKGNGFGVVTFELPEP